MPEYHDTDAESYAAIQNFYAHQMQLLDGGAISDWVATFTEDGVFHAPGYDQPTAGRANIEREATRAAELFAEQRIQRRHCITMLQVVPQSEPDAFEVVSYAMVVTAVMNGGSTVQRSTVCRDRLIRVGGKFLVQYRTVTRDDLPQEAVADAS